MASDAAIKSFRSSFDGEVLLDGDVGYDSARSVWNGDIDRKPGVITRCTTDDHVAAAIRFARSEGLEIAVRGGGHSYPGYGVCDGGLMIDLSAMNGVTVDAGARRARVGGGATWADYDGAAQQHGLASTGGVISHTGVGGLTLGGGIGWLTRKAGLSADNLLGARVVTADGSVVSCSAGEDADLFWALRGGGGNFGVVTDFEFALHEVGPIVNLGLFFWGIDQTVEALTFIRGFAETVAADMAVQIVGLNAPPLPFVPEHLQFAPGHILAVVGWGSPEEHEAAIQPIRDQCPPLFEFVTPIPYTELQKMLDDAAPWGILAYEKALYLNDLSPDAIAVVADFFPRKASPMTIVPVFMMGGAYAAVPDDATAWGGSRTVKWVYNISAAADDPDLLARDRGWVREFWDALLPHAAGSGGYINFQNEPDDERLRESYGATKYDRLAAVKATYDPDNIFHLNANIKPA